MKGIWKISSNQKISSIEEIAKNLVSQLIIELTSKKIHNSTLLRSWETRSNWMRLPRSYQLSNYTRFISPWIRTVTVCFLYKTRTFWYQLFSVYMDVDSNTLDYQCLDFQWSLLCDSCGFHISIVFNSRPLLWHHKRNLSQLGGALLYCLMCGFYLFHDYFATTRPTGTRAYHISFDKKLSRFY